jgi:hypothetical protein
MKTATMQQELQNLLHDIVECQKANNTAKVAELSNLVANEYGEVMHEILQDIYDEYAPDNDVEPLVNYLLHNYNTANNGSEIPTYSFTGIQGVRIFVDEYEGKESRLALIPNPLQLIVNIEGELPTVVWEA